MVVSGSMVQASQVFGNSCCPGNAGFRVQNDIVEKRKSSVIIEVMIVGSTRFVVKPEGVSNVFLTIFGVVNENLGVERHQRGG